MQRDKRSGVKTRRGLRTMRRKRTLQRAPKPQNDGFIFAQSKRWKSCDDARAKVAVDGTPHLEGRLASARPWHLMAVTFLTHVETEK